MLLLFFFEGGDGIAETLTGIVSNINKQYTLFEQPYV